ncbi:MAG: hypothetical protein WBV39_16120 [Rudaea sp.]
MLDLVAVPAQAEPVLVVTMIVVIMVSIAIPMMIVIVIVMSMMHIVDAAGRSRGKREYGGSHRELSHAVRAVHAFHHRSLWFNA